MEDNLVRLTQDILYWYMRKPARRRPVNLGPNFTEALAQAMQELSPRQQYIVTTYYGLAGDAPRTLAYIGRELGISPERVRQINMRALSKLRRLLFKHMLPGETSGEGYD